jgi:hypothetical protein
MTLREIFDKLTPVFSVTLLGYFCAYVFEIGYLRYFDISWQSAHVTVNSFLVTTVIGAGIGFYIKEYVYPFLSALGTTSKSYAGAYLKKKAYFTFIVLTFLFGLLFVFTKNINSWYPLIVFFAIYLAIETILLFAFHWRPHRKIDDIFKQAIEADERRNVIDHKYDNEYTKSFESLFRLMIYLGLIFCVAGMVLAQSLKNIRTIDYNKQTYGVVREYDNLIVAKEISNGHFGSRVLYLNPQSQPIIFKNERRK